MLKKPRAFAFSLFAFWLSSTIGCYAQFDPKPILGQLISALQNCGPPQVYQMLAPDLFQVIALQTQGTGCYPQIRVAGPILNMQVIDQRVFPVGPVFVIRVQHPTAAVDWFMGINQYTNQVQLLMWQDAAAVAPTIATGPGNERNGGSAPSPQPAQSKTVANCDLYPGMC